ncbi:MAG: patatin-like phospholipase family protein [Parvularculaceae bacterium]
MKLSIPFALRQLFALAALLILAAPTAHAEQSANGRPTIGLVLGGGGARGFAHIGVIEAMEEAGLKPDVIAGTSMGAAIGALYAVGYTPAELRAIATDIDWTALFNDATPRDRLIFRRKTDDQLFSTRYKLGFKDGRIALPKGLIQGQKLFLTLNDLLNTRAPGAAFDQTHIPFRAVATDIETRAAVALDSGDLARAVFASMAVPGLLPPVEIDGRTLVDGGLANNLPVSIARDMGADFVIVVDLGTDPLPAEDINSFTDVILQLTSFMTLETATREIASLRAGDVLIQPDLRKESPLAFNRGEALTDLGKMAALAQMDKLRALALRAGDRTAPVADAALAPVISFVALDNRTISPDQLIVEALDIETGAPLDIERLRGKIDDLYGYDLFRRIDYRIVKRDDAYGVVIAADPPDIGNNFLRFGLDYKTDFSTLGIFNATVGYTRRNINAWGGEWRTVVTVGDEPSVTSEFYQPLDALQRWFVSAEAGASRQRVVAFDDDANALGVVKVDALALRLSGGRTFGRNAELRLGVEGAAGRLSPSIGLRDLEPASDEGASVFASFSVDALDSFTFPKGGYAATINAAGNLSDATGLVGDRTLEAQFLGARTFGRTTFVPIVSGVFALDPSVDEFGGALLGGFLNLSGLPRNSRQGRHAIIGSAVVYHEIAGGSGLFSAPLYVGGSLETGNVFRSVDEIRIGNLTQAGSLFLAMDTPLGALIFGGGFTDEGDRSAFLFFGQPF